MRTASFVAKGRNVLSDVQHIPPGAAAKLAARIRLFLPPQRPKEMSVFPPLTHLRLMVGTVRHKT